MLAGVASIRQGYNRHSLPNIFSAKRCWEGIMLAASWVAWKCLNSFCGGGGGGVGSTALCGHTNFVLRTTGITLVMLPQSLPGSRTAISTLGNLTCLESPREPV